jgi:hypothetical protein
LPIVPRVSVPAITWGCGNTANGIGARSQTGESDVVNHFVTTS